MAELIKILLDNGASIYLEADQIDQIDKSDDDLLDPVTGNRVIQRTKDFLEGTFEQIKELLSGLSESVNCMSFQPDELEVGFAIKFTADANIIISSIGTEANITVKMKWEKSKRN